MGTILKTKDLTKKYDNKVVVDNLNIEIQEGEIFGLLGPNGAGKSTTMNMICGIVRPTLGDVEFMEKDFLKNRKKLIENLGYIPQELAIHGNLKAWENVELFTSLYGIKGAELKERIDEFVRVNGTGLKNPTKMASQEDIKDVFVYNKLFEMLTRYRNNIEWTAGVGQYRDIFNTCGEDIYYDVVFRVISEYDKTRGNNESIDPSDKENDISEDNGSSDKDFEGGSFFNFLIQRLRWKYQEELRKETVFVNLKAGYE